MEGRRQRRDPATPMALSNGRGAPTQRERERGREVQLTDGNSAARGQLGLDGVGGTGRGRRGIEAAAQRTRTSVSAATSDSCVDEAALWRGMWHQVETGLRRVGPGAEGGERQVGPRDRIFLN
jgi:hypothetical protein